jgi:hypothetical protein
MKFADLTRLVLVNNHLETLSDMPAELVREVARS